MQSSARKLVLAAAIAAISVCAAHSEPADARVSVGIYATAPPPPLRVETAPRPRGGYVWVPGDWRWAHRRYVWHRGYWVRGRPGWHYAPARWDRDRDRWRYYGGHWER